MDDPSNPNNCDDCYKVVTCLSSCNDTQTSSALVDHYESREVLHRCVPSGAAASLFAYDSELQSVGTLASQAFADLYVTWPVVLGSVLIALIISFVYVLFTKHFAGAVLGVAIILTLAGSIMLSVVLLQTAEHYQHPSTDFRTGLHHKSILRFADSWHSGGYLYGSIHRVCVRGLAILDAGGCDDEGSLESVSQSSSHADLHIDPASLIIGYFVLFVVTTILIATAWTSAPAPFPAYINSRSAIYANTTRVDYTFNDGLRNSFVYTFLHMMWVTQFVIYFAYMVIASVVSRWYFTRSPTGKSKDKPDQKHPVISSVITVTRYHLGTVAFGSLLVAMLKAFRFIMVYPRCAFAPGGHLHLSS